MKRPSLSISPRASPPSSRDQSPSSSPRHGLLASHSPPASPTLSQLDDYLDDKPARRHARKPCIPPSLALSVLLVLTGSLLLVNSFVADYRAGRAQVYELQEQGHLPARPAAVVVDGEGQSRWTVWIPPASSFPLRPWEYQEICAQARHIQGELSGKSGQSAKGYYNVDERYVDVEKAVQTGLLPGSHKGNTSAAADVSLQPLAECEKSMTFVMETTDAGMGNSLLALWLSYGLAKKENRAFFLDDSKWHYGKYSTYFQLLPHQGCKPPLAHERVPCPRSANHLVVSSATFKYVYGSDFAAEFVDKSKADKFQHHKINHLMERGYKDLFRIADTADAVHVQNQTRGILYDNVKKDGGMTIGVHVRHGDLHPWEADFKDDYLPLTRYMNEVRQILIAAYEHDDEAAQPGNSTAPVPSSKPVERAATPIRTLEMVDARTVESQNHEQRMKRHAAPGFSASRVMLASDDPLTFQAPEMSRLVRAQDRIVLASSEDMRQMHDAEHKNDTTQAHDDDEDLKGWDGGFFADVFLKMGTHQQRRTLDVRSSLSGTGMAPHTHQHVETPPPTAAMLAEREIVGRAYVLDLAVLGQSDAVVCAVSSAACRILGVMMGWTRVEKGDWRNVDGKFGWQGLVVNS